MRTPSDTSGMKHISDTGRTTLERLEEFDSVKGIITKEVTEWPQQLQ
jgi:hypothetical protein